MDWFDVRWAAGFFDGEGCVHIARNIRVIISGCFRPGLLDQFLKRWGGQKLTKVSSRKGNQRPGIRWEITGLKAANFLTDVEPYLYEKKAQAQLALKFDNLKRQWNIRGGKGYSHEQRTLLKSITDDIRVLKKVVWHG